VDLFEFIIGGVGMVAIYWLFLARDHHGLSRLHQYRLGKTLADMTSAFELAEQAGGRLELLSPRQLAEAERTFEVGEDRLRKCGPLAVTRALQGNMQLALRLGRHGRVVAQNTLMDRLIGMGLAVDPARLWG
jgi:hypothetical protein